MQHQTLLADPHLPPPLDSLCLFLTSSISGLMGCDVLLPLSTWLLLAYAGPSAPISNTCKHLLIFEVSAQLLYKSISDLIKSSIVPKYWLTATFFNIKAYIFTSQPAYSYLVSCNLVSCRSLVNVWSIKNNLYISF